MTNKEKYGKEIIMCGRGYRTDSGLSRRIRIIQLLLHGNIRQILISRRESEKHGK